MVVDGKHYYDPQNRSKGAVEALKASVEAASNHVVVANGSKMSPPRYLPAERLTVKEDCVIEKSVINSQKARPNASDGSITPTPCSSGSSPSDPPGPMSESIVRLSNPPSPKAGQGSIVASGSFAVAGDPAPRPKSPSSLPLSGPA